MNIQQIHHTLLSHNSLRSCRYLNRYVNLIDHYLKNTCIKDSAQKGLFENHHILPRSMWPEHVTAKWNLVTLPTKTHYIAHYLLFKSFSHRSCVFAFNQMRRVCNASAPNCHLYQSARAEFACLISEINTGRTMSAENRKNKSIKFKGTNVYRNQITGELVRYEVGKEPDGWEPFQIGRVRTEESKSNMAIEMSGRIWQYHPVTQDVKFSHTLHEGYVAGWPKWRTGKQGALKDYKWIHNTHTGESVRIPSHSEIPFGYQLGRGKFNNAGFDSINSQERMKVINLITKQYVMIYKSAYDPTIHMNSGQQLEKVVLYEYKNHVYTQYTQLIEANPELPEFGSRSINMKELKIPKPHQNQTAKRREFCEQHQGKLPAEVGLQVISLLLFEYQKEKIYVKS